MSKQIAENTVFIFSDGREIALSAPQVQQIAESHSWPYEWQVASELKEQRDKYKAQRDQAVAALKDARDAIKELPADILGEAGDAWSTWYIKEELMDSIFSAINAAKDKPSPVKMKKTKRLSAVIQPGELNLKKSPFDDDYLWEKD